MRKNENNYAFIDSQNLNLGILSAGWRLDFERFRVHLKEKYGVTKAILFIGYIPGNNSLYLKLQSAGFVCVFKPTLVHRDGTTKGNCDAELVLHAMIEYENYEKAVIVSGDGDFHCLVTHFIEKEKLSVLLIPNKYKYSGLLKVEEIRPYVRFLNDQKRKLERIQKRPQQDGT
jgi:uncharacterized LabA/DUF88 family protein